MTNAIDIYITMGSYAAIIIFSFIAMNFLTKGFILNYLLVKASQGKKVLIEIHSATDVYFKQGKWIDGVLEFKNRAKEKKPLAIQEVSFRNAIFTSMGVPMVKVDEAGNKIMLKDLSVGEFAIDSGTLDTMLIRIKNRPVLKKKQEMLIIIVLVIVVLVALFTLFKVINIEKAITSIAQISGNIR